MPRSVSEPQGEARVPGHSLPDVSSCQPMQDVVAIVRADWRVESKRRVRIAAEEAAAVTDEGEAPQRPHFRRRQEEEAVTSPSAATGRS